MFDRNRDGHINYLEFLRTIRDDLNDFRRDVVERVFIILDKHNDGVLDIADLKSSFNPKRHPDVMEGKKSVDAALMEFVDTFE